MKIGVIGIGKMGRPIANRLVTAGHELYVCNRSRSAGVRELEGRGAGVRSTPAEIAGSTEMVLTALPTEDIVRRVYAELATVATAGQCFIDHSTVSPGLSEWCARVLAEHDASFLDAPVSGGPGGAEAGTLTVMVGGDEAAFTRALPVLEAFAGKVRRCGPTGAGQVMKLVNQYLVAVHTMASAEAAAIAVQLGADLQTAGDILGTSFGGSAMLTRNLPRFISRDFSPATPVELLVKDLSIVHAQAAGGGVPLLLGGVVEQCFLAAKARGWGGDDMSALVRFWDRQVSSPPPNHDVAS